VVSHQQSIVFRDEGQHSLRQGRSSGKAILGQGNRSQTDADLREQGDVQRTACRGEARGDGGMGVHDADNIGTQPVNRQVHRNLGGALTPAFHLISFRINNNQVIRGHPAFADFRGRAEDMPGIEPERDIPVVCRYPTLLVDQPAYFNDLLAQVLFRRLHWKFDCTKQGQTWLRR